MEAVLKEKKFYKYVSGGIIIDSKNREDDQAVQGFIMARVEPIQRDLVVDKINATAKETWDLICAHHEKGGPQATMLAIGELVRLAYNEGDDMRAHLNHVREIYNRLTTLQMKMDEKILSAFLLNSLNSSWSPTVQTLVNTATFTLQTVSAALIEESLRRKDILKRDGHGQSTALYAQRTNTQHNSGLSDQRRSDKHCTHCGRDNHTVDECWQKHGRPNSRRRPDNNKAHVTATSSKSDNNSDRIHDMAYITQTAHFTPGTNDADRKWLLDSGAGGHYCCQREWFESFTPTEGQQVGVGGGAVLPILGTGEVSISTPSGGLYKWPASYVPDLGVNLISIGYAAETNHRMLFSGSKDQFLTIHSKDDPSLPVLKGQRNNNRLYELVTGNEQVACAVEQVACIAHSTSSVPNQSMLELWHQRLAHLSHQAVIDLFKKNMSADAKSVSKTLKDAGAPAHCEACVLGKHKRSAIPITAHDRATRPLHRVHVDLCGPMTPARDGSLYLMLVVDDCTRYTWMAALHTKAQAFDAFKRYVAMAEAEHSTRVSSIRSDNGGEFLSTAFNAWLSEKGIQRELTTAHSPWQNGVVERMNRTVVEGSRTLLSDAKLPKTLWVLACYATIYCRNRSPTSTLSNSTPYEQWHHVKPNHLHLRRFGCLAYRHIRKEERSKFDPKAAPYTFVGYALDSSAYLLWDGNDIIKSRDVHFVEHLLGTEADQAKVDDVSSSINEEDGEDSKEGDQLLTSSTAASSLKPISHNDEFVSSEAPAISSSPGLMSSPLTKKAEKAMKRLKKELGDRNQSGPKDVAPSIIAQVAPSTIAHLAYIVYGSAYITSDLGSDTPTYLEAISSAKAPEWKKAMDREIASLKEAGTFTVCKLPPGFKAIGGKWVLKIKRGGKLEILKHKARFVAQGFLQRYGVDYIDTYAPVARIPSIRIIIALAAHHDWDLHQMDVKSAYLNGDLEEEIYMYQPEGYVVSDKDGPLVWRLNKSLYGLKQAGRTWHQKIDVALKRRGLSTLDADHCIYVKRDSKIVLIIALYVDDLLIASNSHAELTKFKSDLASEFKMEDLGEASFILGIKIVRDRTKRMISISQTAYINALLERHGMNACHGISTPMEISSKLCKADDEQMASESDTRDYQCMIGGIMFAMLCTRPDISFAVTCLSQFSSNPLPEHIQALKRVLRYLKSTVNVGLNYTGTDTKLTAPALIGYSDADWGQSYDRRSITGYTFLLCGGAISWQSKKQRTVALSTVEAEYMATTHAAKEALWWRTVFNGLGYDTQQPTIIWSDSQGSISLAGNPEHHTRTKHIDIQYHFIRQHLADQTITLKFVGSESMAADCLTKALERVRHEKGMDMLGLASV